MPVGKKEKKKSMKQRIKIQKTLGINWRVKMKTDMKIAEDRVAKKVVTERGKNQTQLEILKEGKILKNTKVSLEYKSLDGISLIFSSMILQVKRLLSNYIF